MLWVNVLCAHFPAANIVAWQNNEWTNERTNKRRNDRTNERTHESTSERMNLFKDGMYEWINEWTSVLKKSSSVILLLDFFVLFCSVLFWLLFCFFCLYVLIYVRVSVRLWACVILLEEANSNCCSYYYWFIITIKA